MDKSLYSANGKEVKRFKYLSCTDTSLKNAPCNLLRQNAVYLARVAKRVKQPLDSDGLVGVRERTLGDVEVGSRNATAK